MERLQNLRFQSYGQASEQAPLDDIAPTIHRPHQRRRMEDAMELEEHIEQTMEEEEQMDEMLNAFYDMDPIIEPQGVVNEHKAEGTQARRSQTHLEPEEEVMRKLARLPLYNGAKISVLRASLAMLNLQSIFGWSDASVSELFK